MKRALVAPRRDWEARLTALEFHDYRREDGTPYWIEDACFELSAAEADAFRIAAHTCERLIAESLTRVFERSDLLARLGLTLALADLAAASWRRRDPHILGRYDFAWDGAPKLLEYNADTPSMTYESGIVQADWLAGQDPAQGGAAFNALDERHRAAWRNLAPSIPGVMHVMSVHDDYDSYGAALYAADCAAQAGVETCLIDARDIGLRGGALVDLEDRPITHLLKQYPWGWLARENAAFFAALADIAIIEPAWRAAASSKGMLVDIWEHAPDCPFLLPASFDANALRGDKVGKPVLGRQGANLRLRFADAAHDSDGPYADQPIVWQARAPMRAFDGWTPVFSVWVIAGEPCALAIREDRGLVTGANANFIPHRIV